MNTLLYMTYDVFVGSLDISFHTYTLGILIATSRYMAITTGLPTSVVSWL